MARATAVLRKAAPAKAVAATRADNPDPVDFGPLEDYIGFHLRMAQIAAFHSFAHYSQEVGFSPGRYAALLLIGRNPGISQTGLSRAIGSDKSTLTPVLDNLTKRGLIRRDRPRNDRRLYRLTLTAAGDKVLRELNGYAARHERNLDAIVGPRDRALFVRLLRKISDALVERI